MYKTRHRLFGLAFAVVLGVLLAPSMAFAKSSGSAPMHRLYNRWTGEHFYTASTVERDSLTDVGWNYEGIGWYAPKQSDTPVYRLYNKYVPGGDHHYTTNINERNILVQQGWIDEGIGWYSDDGKTIPLYREYNPYATTGTHNYTSNETEHKTLVRAGWEDEGVAWYGVSEFVGNWRGTLDSVQTYGNYDRDRGDCFGGRQTPPTVTITNVDNVAGTFTADLTFIVHNHASVANAVESCDGDQVITLRNVLFSNSTALGFDINGTYTGHIGTGYLNNTPGMSDEYKVQVFGSSESGLSLRVNTSSVFNTYNRSDLYTLNRM